MSTTSAQKPGTSPTTGSGQGPAGPKTPPFSNPSSKGSEPPPIKKEKVIEPTLSSLRDWLIGKEVSIYSPPGHILTVAYAESNDGKSAGVFHGKVLDLTMDQNSGEPLFLLLEYKQKNARRYYQRDVLPVKGCAISLSLEREEEDQLAEA